GVLGAVCASVGSVMATEAVKLVTGIGEPLVGRLLVHDALRQTWDAVPVRHDPGCAVCGAGADGTRPLGWATAHVEGGATAPVPEGAVSRPAVGVGELARLLGERDSGAADFVLVDVREPGERDVAEIPGSVLHPVGLVRAGRDLPVTGGRVYVYCKSGARSAEAVDLLRARGVDAVDVTGGVLAWSREVDPSVPTY
ncbi:MAG: adenylyltransferase/sulfurtransferase MoeZ, partial [Gammaproteobacteria bacterium]|nr:adenylyltransferase/sulfurtransferase MoeZ [Gammaproteobacteria bacterium]